MLKKLFFLLLILLTIIDVSYASFPVLPTEQIEIAVENNTFEDPWYISVKNAILFLASSFIGLSFLGAFIKEAFLVPDFQGWTIVFLLLLAIPFLFASVFYGKKVWGDGAISNGDKLSKKIVIWSASIFVVFIIVGNIIYAGGGMGG